MGSNVIWWEYLCISFPMIKSSLMTLLQLFVALFMWFFTDSPSQLWLEILFQRKMLGKSLFKHTLCWLFRRCITASVLLSLFATPPGILAEAYGKYGVIGEIAFISCLCSEEHTELGGEMMGITLVWALYIMKNTSLWNQYRRLLFYVMALPPWCLGFWTCKIPFKHAFALKWWKIWFRKQTDILMNL